MTPINPSTMENGYAKIELKAFESQNLMSDNTRHKEENTTIATYCQNLEELLN